MAQNVLSSHNFFYNLCKSFKNRAKLVYFERDLQKPQEIYFMEKVGGKGIL